MSDPAVPGVRADQDAETRCTIGTHAPVLPPGSPTATLPERIGRYQILALLGKGGMGAVYLAHDTQFGRRVALKVPHRDGQDAGTLERFYREARSAGRLQHPNIVPIYEVGQVDGVHLMTMAYIEGRPLADRVAEYAQRPPRDAVVLVRTLALALQEAHGQGVIHRDLKPQNIMLDKRDEPIIMDFGLAREVRTDSTGQTLPGTVLGTPAYMPPEQARGDVTAIGPGSDVYSLGVILYELLTGRTPFCGNVMDVLAQHLRDIPPPPSEHRPELGKHLDTVCLKALAKEPSQRFLSMIEFAQALGEYLDAPAGTVAGGVLEESDELASAAAAALVLLRTWGWQMGIEKIQARFVVRTDARLDLMLRLLEGETEAFAAAPTALAGLRQLPVLRGWALLGQAFIHNRNHDFSGAEPPLQQIEEVAVSADNILRAGIAHQRGFRAYHLGNLDVALAALHDALDLCGPEHYLTGRVLDTLGLVYIRMNKLYAACDFFERAIARKERFADRLGVVYSQHQLGQLYLEWGFPERAEAVFQKALELAMRHQDERLQAITYHYLGRVAHVQGERELAAGRRHAALKSWGRAADWLDASIRSHQANQRDTLEGYARRYRALVYLSQGKLEEADAHLRRSESLFEQAAHARGLAGTQAVRGALERRRQNYAEAERLLRLALVHFERTNDSFQSARILLECARTLADFGALAPLVSGLYLDALRRAEECRRASLIREIEEELRGVNEEAHWNHVFQRARGRGASTDTSSLDEGESEVATALFLNVVGFMASCQGMDAAEVLRTLNQMMADMNAMLERHRAHVVANLGGGFMVIVRGPGHAERAIDAALELIGVVEQFNRPRVVLGLPALPVRIGVASGSLFLGNVGTYAKMDFTAIGVPVNLASRLMREADPRLPCISQETYERVRDRFEFAPGNPRTLELAGIGRRDVWDVAGRKKGSSHAT